MPSSSSGMSMIFLPWRAASRAASLTKLARSAPVKPGVWAARVSKSMCLAIGLPRVWTERMASRPAAVGAVDHDLAVEAARAQQRGV